MKFVKDMYLFTLLIWVGLMQPVLAEESYLNILKENHVLIEVPVSQSVVAESVFPFSDVAIADPKIADFSILSDKSIYILGKKPGQTTLTFLNQDDELISNIDVKVTLDISELQSYVAKIFPDQNINIFTAADVIILSGTVDETSVVNRLMSLTERYAPGKVSNLLIVKNKKPFRIKVDFIKTNSDFEQYLTAPDFQEFFLNEASLIKRLHSAESIKTVSKLPFFTLDAKKQGLFKKHSFKSLLAIKSGMRELQEALNELEEKNVIMFVESQSFFASTDERIALIKPTSFSLPINVGEIVQVFEKDLGISLRVSLSLPDNDIIPITLDLQLSAPEPIDPSSLSITSGMTINSHHIVSDIELRNGQAIAVIDLFNSHFEDNEESITWMKGISLLDKFIKMEGFKRGKSGLSAIISVHLND